MLVEKAEIPHLFFFTLKWSRIKNLAEIKKCQLKKLKNLSIPTIKTKNTQLSNSNHLKTLKASSLNQVFNVDNKENILNSESLLRSKADLDNINNEDLKAIFLATNAKNF